MLVKNKILVLLVLLSVCYSFSQNFELRATPYLNCKLIYNDKTSEKGLLKMASSVFDPRFKFGEKDKEKKIDFKDIDTILINPDTEKERIFQYKNHNYSKFKIFTELVYSDSLSVYISLNESMNLFYSDFDRETVSEMVVQVRNEQAAVDNNIHLNYGNRQKTVDSLNLPNGKKIKLPSGYEYVNNLNNPSIFNKSKKFTFYLLKQGNPMLYRVEKNKRYLKNAMSMLDDCECIVSDIQQKKVMVKDIATFIEYYKDMCF